ncbi:phosphoacetylglucosamine mutase [Tanacetum coccineum]
MEMSIGNYEWHEFFPNDKILRISNIYLIVILLIFGYDILYLFEVVAVTHNMGVVISIWAPFVMQKPARPKKKTADGLVIYSEEELGFGKTDAGEKKNAAKRLWAVTKLINQVVGDALSMLLLVEAILQHMGWPVDKWNELYHDLPSRQFKLPQNVVSSSSALANSPAFVRPSRTPTSARFGSALNIKTLVAAAERKETPIDETIKELLLNPSKHGKDRYEVRLDLEVAHSPISRSRINNRRGILEVPRSVVGIHTPWSGFCSAGIVV